MIDKFIKYIPIIVDQVVDKITSRAVAIDS